MCKFLHLAWWRHQMETFSALLALCARGIHRSPVNSPCKGRWRGALIFSFICAWINGWVNNCKAGDLRRHRAHYDVTVMGKQYLESPLLPIKLQQGIQWITNHLIPSCPSFLFYFSDDVTACKRIPHYWPFIEGILPKGPYPPCLRMADRALLAGYPRYKGNRLGASPHKWTIICSFNVFYVVNQSKLMNTQSSCLWFQTPWRFPYVMLNDIYICCWSHV